MDLKSRGREIERERSAQLEISRIIRLKFLLFFSSLARLNVAAAKIDGG